MADTPQAIPLYHQTGTPVKRFLTASQVAAMYGITARTVRKWAKAGRVKAFRIGGRGHFHFDASQLPEVSQ
jgi:excisionase family DNA binding protein